MHPSASSRRYNLAVTTLPSPFDLIIVGGGPAGFFAAAACAAAQPASRIVILEKSAAVLAKVRISGGGRCNITHACFDPAQLVQFYPRGSQALRGAFSRFQPSDTIAWFETHGAALKTEPDGRVFPVSDSSLTIIACLESEIRRAGVQVRTHAGVKMVRKEGQTFQVEINSGEVLASRSVLLTTGGDRAGFELISALGHSLVPPAPSLFTFTITDPRLKNLPGISVQDVRLTLPAFKLEQRGPLLVTHWGVSGPVVLRLSAWGARPLFQASYRTPLLINWLPDAHLDSAHQVLLDAKIAQSRQYVSAHSPISSLPQRLWQELTTFCGISADQTWANTSRVQLARLSAELVRGEYAIIGKGEFKDEFVTCGGIALSEVDFRSMQSKKIPGLFFAGEVLDIDGLTGGFNFQNAWTTGWIAGQSIARQA
jgi:predicted Rossmann fold flavoprotein